MRTEPAVLMAVDRHVKHSGVFKERSLHSLPVVDIEIDDENPPDPELVKGVARSDDWVAIQ